MVRGSKGVSFALLLAAVIFILGFVLVVSTELVSRNLLKKAFKQNSTIIRQNYIAIKKEQVRDVVFRLVQMMHAVDIESRYQMNRLVRWGIDTVREEIESLSKILSIGFSSHDIRNIIISLIEESSFYMGDGAFVLVTRSGDVLNRDRFGFSKKAKSMFLLYAHNFKEFYLQGRTADGERFVGYVSFFKDLGLYVMAYVLPSSFLARIQRKFIVSVVKTNSYVDPNDYFFIVKTNGDVIVIGNRLFDNGTKVWKIFGEKREGYIETLFEEELRLYRIGGGFVEYKWLEPKTGKINEKISYISGYRPWGWIVGKGFYLDEVNGVIGSINSKLYAVIESIENSISLLVFALLLLLVIFSYLIFRFTKRKMSRLLNRMDLAFVSGDKIPVADCWINEIKSVASYVNMALDRFEEYEDEFLEAFVRAMETRDLYTKGHSQRVGLYASIIAKALGMDESNQRELYKAGLLHDIGKLGIPDNILLKPGRLTGNEYRIIQYHSVFSYDIVSSISRFKNMAGYIRHHHERCDGSGYPDGLVCEDIEIEARILAIADVFDALTTSRPYRGKLSPNEAIELMEKEPLDQEILKRSKDVLVKSCIQEKVSNVTTEIEDVEKIRKELFDIDYKTGLKRRRVVVENAEKLIKDNIPFALFMVDIKELNFINFEFSHDVGDKFIYYTAMVLEETLKEMGYSDCYLSRAYDDAFLFIVRLDGEEVDPAGITKRIKGELIRRVKEMFAKEKQQFLSKSNKSIEGFVDFHVVYAVYPDEGKDPEELMYVCINKKDLEASDLYIDYDAEN